MFERTPFECTVTSCKYYDEKFIEYSGCTRNGKVRIVTPFYAFPAPAVCEGYEEEEDESENR